MIQIIFGDIQGNYQVLQRFCQLTKELTDKIYCLGDIVNKGERYDENRCIDLLIENNVVCIQGNHDIALIEKYNKTPELVLRKMTKKSIDYLLGLPKELIIGDIHLSHQGPTMSKRIFTVNDAENEFEVLKRKQRKISFYGHSHKIAVFSSNDGRIELKSSINKPIILQKDKLYLINPGGIGLRFGELQSYALLNNETRTIEFKILNR